MIRIGLSCSWCHSLMWNTDPKWPICRECGHRVDVPRFMCDCSACRAMKLAYLKANAHLKS